VRGDDHVNNTPRQINIIRALGAEPPVYAHLPTVLGEDGHKLSKRHGAVSVMQYEELGFLPDAMINFLARLGWAHGDDEIFSREELVAWFELDAINPAPARFDTKKLNWVNQEHMKRASADALGERLLPYLGRAGLDAAKGPAPGPVAVLLRDRVATLVEMADAAHYFYATPHVPADKLAATVTPASKPALADVLALFSDVDWTREALGAALKAVAARHGLKPGEVMMPLRMLVCGTRETPAIDAVLSLLGRDETCARLERGLAAA
jgi:glutamyl-tRNA synthetase